MEDDPKKKIIQQVFMANFLQEKTCLLEMTLVQMLTLRK